MNTPAVFALPERELEPCELCGQPADVAVPMTVCELCRVYFSGGFNVVTHGEQS